MFFECIVLGNKKTTVYLHPPLLLEELRKRKQIGALSSVGSEHLPYKQGVTGSNPVGPTSSRKPAQKCAGFFIPGEGQIYLSLRRE